MEHYRTVRTYSAGGVVFRLVPVGSQAQAGSSAVNEQGVERMLVSTAEGDALVEVVLVGRSQMGLWALPKGTPKQGETIEQVALREVQEETGLVVRLIAYVGSISYFFVRNQVRYQKQVRHFLLEAVGGDTALHDHEYDMVEWFPLPEAGRRLSYQNEVNILYQAEHVLQEWLKHRRKEV